MSIVRHQHYKATGVECISEVPEHWSLKRLRFVAKVNPSKAELGSISIDTAVSFLPMEAIRTVGPPDLAADRPFAEVANGYTYFRDGDVAFAKITPCFEIVMGRRHPSSCIGCVPRRSL